ncbi:MAG: MATE family efflux transporter [Saprospiraceae bacterium]|nr:MATE family efflux transporter [Saprospiraceae bacterium]
MNKEILRLAIPNILSNISVPLLSTVDTALMGHLSEAHLGAVGIGSMIFNFIYWNFGFLRMGTTGLTAQAHGANNKTDCSHNLGRSLLVGMGLSLVLLALQLPLEWLSIKLLQVDQTLDDLVHIYFSIRIWAAPATLALYVLFGWFFGMQNALYPLYLTIAINLCNIGLSFLFIMHYDMGIAGVALGTVIAQYLGLLAGIVLLIHRYTDYIHLFGAAIFREWSAIQRFFMVNGDLFLRTLCLTFVFAFFYSQSSAAGTTILAVNVILLQLTNWVSYGIDGFAFAAEALVGKYRGAEQRDKVTEAIRYSMYWGLSLAVLFSMALWLEGKFIYELFTNQQEVIRAGLPFMWYMILFPLVGFLSYIWDGIYIGLTATRTMRNAMFLSLAIFLVIHYLLKPHYGNDGLWIALLLFMLIRGLIQSLYYRRFGWALP